MARRIIGAAFISMDGVIQAPGGPDEDTQGGFAYGGWLTTMFDEGLGNQIDTYLRPPFDLLLGRRTYDIFAAHWPFIPLDDPISAMFAQNSKYVLTGCDQPLTWAGSHRLADMDAVAALKQQDGPDLLIQGSSTIYPQLLQRGLLDRLILMVAPAVLGSGKRLFGEGTPAGAFRLIEHRVTSGGHAMATYEPSGKVEVGSFAMPESSDAELARQKKMRDGTW